MKYLLLFFSFFLLLPTGQAQLSCEEVLPMRIIAPSGLNMRSKPSLNSSVVVTIPYDSLVSACRNTEGRMTYDKMVGYWRKAEYRGKKGYLFDVFMELALQRKPSPLTDVPVAENEASPAPNEKEEPSQKAELKPAPAKEKTTEAQQFQFVTEAYNYCGNISSLDPGLLWYGFYPTAERDPEQAYRIMPVELNVVLSKAKLGNGMEFDIETQREERSIFLLGLNRPLDYRALIIKDQSERLRYTGRKVYPGQRIDLGQGLALSATGSVESSGPCPDLKNYHLKLIGSNFEQDLSALIPSGQCGMPELYWYGDFSGDGIPEVILVSVYEDKNHFSLLISENTNSQQLLKLQAEWIIDKCY